MFKFIAFVLLVAGAQAQSFWQSCNLPGVDTPDSIISSSCLGDRCTVTRGVPLLADAYFTPSGAFTELRATARAFHSLLPANGANVS